jgi:hypothetical protein
MTRRDKTSLDMIRPDETYRHQDHHHRGPVPSPTKDQCGRVDTARVSQHFWAVRIIPARAMDAREAAYRRTIQFATVKVPKLTKTTLVNTKVHLFIQYIQQLLRQEACDESVMGNMIDTETISLLQFLFHPTETRRRHHITTH